MPRKESRAPVCEPSSRQRGPVEAGSGVVAPLRVSVAQLMKNGSQDCFQGRVQRLVLHWGGVNLERAQWSDSRARKHTKAIQFAPQVGAHLRKHFDRLVEEAGQHVFGHRQEISSALEDTQQSQSVALSVGESGLIISDDMKQQKHHINKKREAARRQAKWWSASSIPDNNMSDHHILHAVNSHSLFFFFLFFLTESM